MSWLTEYRDAAKRTDQLVEKSDHAELLAAGLFGEAGSVFAEIKKKGREMQAYPAYQKSPHRGDWRPALVLDPAFRYSFSVFIQRDVNVN